MYISQLRIQPTFNVSHSRYKRYNLILLRNMVEKKLNFNQPILSVRRNSPSKIVDQRRTNNVLPTIHSLRPLGPEPKSDPIRNTGAVPFQWEQSPGRPKEEILAQCRDLEAVPGATRFLDETNRDTSEQSRSCSDYEDCSSEAVVEQQQQREQRRKVVNQERPILLHCRPNFDNRNLHYNEKEEKEESNEHDQTVITVCCLLPRSCLKSAVCSLNPVPAVSAMNRVMTFPASRILSATLTSTSLSSFSTECENECKEHDAPGKMSFRTLQELLADEGGVKELNSRDCVETSKEMNTVAESDQDSSSEEDMIRLAVNKAAKNAQLSRAKTLGNAQELGIAPPPLPESPSDSWLFRTVSAKKASSSTPITRFTNK